MVEGNIDSKALSWVAAQIIRHLVERGLAETVKLPVVWGSSRECKTVGREVCSRDSEDPGGGKGGKQKMLEGYHFTLLIQMRFCSEPLSLQRCQWITLKKEESHSAVTSFHGSASFHISQCLPPNYRNACRGRFRPEQPQLFRS